LSRGLAVAACASGLFLVSSCYRAEIELSMLMEGDAAQAGNAMAGAAAGGGGPGDRGEGGASGMRAAEGGGGAGGEPNESSCDDVLDPNQEICRRVGVPSAEECVDLGISGWQGCYFSACHACTKSLREYEHYFAWHPCCQRNPTCGSNEPKMCTSACPQPTERDKRAPCLKAL
jgi:hypothetical protein